jgi:hypothetical protein
MEVMKIRIHDDPKIAPRYTSEVKQLYIDEVVITEKGTVNSLPVIDIQLVDADGNKYFTMTTGSLVNTLAGAIQGINKKNHGRGDL